MQHKDIPDGERHELKGASTALLGSVPVANGGGGTSFQKIGTASLSGSIPSNIPDLAIATDGSGAFKAVQPRAYGSYRFTSGVADVPNPSTPSLPKTRYAGQTDISNSVGLSCVNGVLNVNTSGYYMFTAASYVVTGEDPAPSAYTSYYAPLVNLSTGATVANAAAGPQIVFLAVSTPYVVLSDIPVAPMPPMTFTILKVS